MQTFKSTSCLAGVVAMAIQAAPVQAATTLPGSVRDLVGVRASSGEQEMTRRGFKQVHTSTSGSRKYGTWWNENTNECIVATTYDGTYESLAVTNTEDCKKKGDGGKTAAIAIGAAALIGALAIAGSSGSKDKDKDEKYRREYDRGYRDGYDGRRYDNWDNTSAYTDGYNEGRRQSNRPGNGNWGGSGGSWNNNGWINTNDLVGRPSSQVWRELGYRGFQLRDDKWNRGERYATFWRSRSEQCIVVRARYETVNSIQNTSSRTCDR
ncbi:hypothetical protein [Novosphingobium huizhouense]|uniref:hypothetical protein n=1 Tax=Novosphingobium huizhouense TaxID=2866625 RepID=UPI001CD8E68C|nr:hypothetical protein [Novosphingobium huizhouense]